MVSVDSSARAAGPDAVAIGRKRNVVKMRRVQAIGNGQPIIGNGPRTLIGKRPTAAALRLERLDRSAVPPSRDIVVRDYDAFMAERVRLAAAEAGNPGKEEAHTIAAPASTAPASPAFPPLPLAGGGLRLGSSPWILTARRAGRVPRSSSMPHWSPRRSKPNSRQASTCTQSSGPGRPFSGVMFNGTALSRSPSPPSCRRSPSPTSCPSFHAGAPPHRRAHDVC